MEMQDNNFLTPLAARIMQIDDITWGDPEKTYIVRYGGRIYNEDTAAAYDQLAESLRPYEITPIFRKDKDRHLVVLIKGLMRPTPSKIWVNVVMFMLTVVTVLLAGALYAYDGPITSDQLVVAKHLVSNLGDGIPFALSLMAILTAHEFGHYLAGRFHKTHVTLPYFIPLPFSPLGTMGAFIQIKELPKNKRIMLDIGIAGPLAGLMVAIPVLLLGLWLSPVDQLPVALGPTEALSLEGNSLLYLGMKLLVKGELLPAPHSYGGLSPILYWVRYFFTGTPLPWGGQDVLMHPVAWAGWAGLLVTALNLIPAGQLDGGHILYVLLGERAKKFVPFIIGALALMGFAWNGWWLWVLLILWVGRVYMEPLDQITQLDSKRKALAVLAIILFVLVFTPVPLINVMAGG